LEDFSGKTYGDNQKEKLLEYVLKLTLEGNSPLEIAKLTGKETDSPIYAYQSELVTMGKLIKSDSGRLRIYEVIDNIGSYEPLTRKAFLKIPVIKSFFDQNTLTDKDSQMRLMNAHISRLCTFCNTVLIHPDQVIKAEDRVDFLAKAMMKFRQSLNESTVNYLKPNNTRIKKSSKEVSHHPYSRAWASLLESSGLPLKKLPPSHILNRSRQAKSDYSNIHLTYNQFRQGIQFIKDNYDKRYLAIFLLMVEIYPRSNSVFTNPIDINIKYVEVDGNKYPYGMIDKWYESKQETSFPKIIIDPEVLRYIQDTVPKGETIFKEEIEKHKKEFNNIMRKFYVSINLLPEGVLKPQNDPDRPVFRKNTDQFYLDLDPTYTLRHTGAIFSCYRCDFQTNKVSKMGWKKTETLEENYASVPIESIIEDSKCLYCNPPLREGENLVFCKFAHSIAYFNNGRKPKEGVKIPTHFNSDNN